MRHLHEVRPDVRRQAAAGHPAHRRVIVIADPHAANIGRGEADKPGIAPVLAGAGLAGHRPVLDARIVTGTDRGVHHAGQHGVHVGGIILRIHTFGLRRRLLEQHVAARIRHLGDDVGLHSPPAGLEHAVGAGDLPEAHFLAAEGERGIGLQRAPDAEPLGEFRHPFGIGLVAKLGGNRIRRARQRLAQRHRADILAVIVHRPPLADADRAVVEHVIRRVAVFEGQGVHERFEAGARLALGLRHAVEGRCLVVGAARHRDDTAIRAEDQRSGLRRLQRRAVLRQPLGHARLHAGLQLRINRQRHHGVAGNTRQHGGQPLGRDIQHIAKLGIIDRRLDDVDLRLQRGLLFLARDEPLGAHLAQHIALTVFRPGKVLAQVQLRGRLGQRRQQRGFRNGHLLRRLAEIVARGRIDAVEARAEIHPVEIQAQDLVLGHPLFELAGERDFLRLALHRLAGMQHQVLHQLLRDCRSAGDRLAGHGIRRRCAHDGRLVGAVMLVEPLVFRCDKRLRHMARQILHVDGTAIARTLHRQRLATGVDELDRRLAVGVPEFGNVGGQLRHAIVQAVPLPRRPQPAHQQDRRYRDQHIAHRRALPAQESRGRNAHDAGHLGRGGKLVAHVCRAFSGCLAEPAVKREPNSKKITAG